MLPQVLSRIANKQPGLTVGVSFGSVASLLEQLRGDGIEFLICSKVRLPRDGLLAVTPLLRVPLTWLVRAGHPLAQRTDVTFDMLSDYPVASVRSDFTSSREGGAGMLLDTPIAFACDDYQILLSTIVHCDAVCLASSALLPSHPGVAALDIADGPIPKENDIVIVTRRGRALSPATTLLLQQVRSIADAISDNPPSVPVV